MKCKDCKYYEPLTNHPESWGTCEWFKRNRIQVPFWSHVTTRYGALLSNTNICKVGKPRSDA